MRATSQGKNVMQIEKGANLAVVVRRTWVNLHGVKMFLRRHDTPEKEIRGVDESHILFATVLDAEDTRGVWIELGREQEPSDSLGRVRLLVPWNQILTIVIADRFPAAIRQEARKIGFTGETEPE